MRNLQFADDMAAARAVGRKTVTRRLNTPVKAGDVVYHGEALVRSRAGTIEYRVNGQWVFDGGMPVEWPWKRKIQIARYCPERCARMFSLVRSVRVERLHEITEADAIAEGVLPLGDVGCPCEGEAEDPGPHLAACAWSHPGIDRADCDPDNEPHRAAFAVLWDRINRAPSKRWSANPQLSVVDLGRPLTRDEATSLVKIKDPFERLGTARIGERAQDASEQERSLAP